MFSFHVPRVCADNASRECLPGGVWEDKTNYSQCQPLMEAESGGGGAGGGGRGGHGGAALDDGGDYTFVVYLTGYSFSLVALLIACSTFVYFK